MFEIISVQDRLHWDNIVQSFPNYDVYYLNGYVKAFQLHGDGEPQLLFYESNGLRAIYVYMKRKTFIDGLYDSITPYGYGGVLFDGDTSDANLQIFWNAYKEKMRELGIVNNFVRYHPILQNATTMKCVSDVIDLGKTIVIDLSSPEVIWENITSKNRNTIRKAQKYNIKILHSCDYSLLEEFVKIYNGTMDKDGASDYYYFKEDFYRSIHEDLNQNYKMFYAVYEGKIIAMSIMLFANQQMHYHLSGSIMEYRKLAPSNLLLYEAALWGYSQGYKTLHLGGGLGSKEDRLYAFKAAFNRNSNCQFSISKQIFDIDKYNLLVAKRVEDDPHFDTESHFFPLYRA